MKLIALILLSMPLIAFARDEIKILSFVMNDHASNTATGAEICGTVNSSDRRKKFEKVVITSDPGRNAAIYVANVSPNGVFCHNIRTITRKAQVDFFRDERRRAADDLPIYTLTK